MSARHTAPRDQEEGPFSDILAGFWRAHDSVLAACFVDAEGECIDYYSSLDPFEAKVAGAHMVATLSGLLEPCERAGLGRPRLWIVEAAERDLVIASVDGDYAVVLVLHARGLTARLLEAIEGLVEAFGLEAGVHHEVPSVHVELSPKGGEPIAVALPSGMARVACVLARWSEPGALSDAPLRCYRVRLERDDMPDGIAPEITVVHDPHLGSFRIRRRPSTPPPG